MAGAQPPSVARSLGVKRLAAARLWHEGNSFSPAIAELDQFRQCEWVMGDAVPAYLYRGTSDR